MRIQVSIRELHSDLTKQMMKLDAMKFGRIKLLVSDTGLRFIIPINVRPFTQ